MFVAVQQFNGASAFVRFGLAIVERERHNCALDGLRQVFHLLEVLRDSAVSRATLAKT